MNLRHILFTVSMVPSWQSWTHLQRAVAGFGLTDEVYVVVASEKGYFEHRPEVVGTVLIAYLSWIGSTVAGAWGRVAFLPALAEPLELALAALFVALLVPVLRARPKARASLVGGVLCRSPAGPWLVMHRVGWDPRCHGRRRRGHEAERRGPASRGA